MGRRLVRLGWAVAAVAAAAAAAAGCSAGDDGACGVSSPGWAVVSARVGRHGLAGAPVFSHRRDGTMLAWATTDRDGCAGLISEPDALVTVVFTAGGDPTATVTTTAPDHATLVVYGPHRTRPALEVPAGRLTILPGAVPIPQPEPGDGFALAYDLGCTADGCMRGRGDALPWTIDVPARAIGPGGDVTITVTAEAWGQRCCDSHGFPYTFHTSWFITGATTLDGGDAEIGPGFAPVCQCSGLDCRYLSGCEPRQWPVTIDLGLLAGSPQVNGEIETGGLAWATGHTWEIDGPCTPDNGWLGTCSAVLIPVGLTADHATLSFKRYLDARSWQVSRVRATGEIALGPGDVLPQQPAPALFAGPTDRDLEVPATTLPVDALAVVLPGYAPDAPWTVVLPPSGGRLTLPVAAELPVPGDLAWLVWVDSSDLDGFDELGPAGIHVDQLGPLTSEQRQLFPPELDTIVPLPRGTLRMTATQAQPCATCAAAAPAPAGRQEPDLAIRPAGAQSSCCDR